MPLAANALTTYDTAREELGLAAAEHQAVIERLINSASQAIEKYCGRQFGRRETTDRLQGSGTLRLVLPRSPLVELLAIEEDGEEVELAEVTVEDAAAGILYRAAGWRRHDRGIPGSVSGDVVPGAGSLPWAVTYSAGWVLPKDHTEQLPRDLPYDVEEAALITVVSMFRRRGEDQRIASESFGNNSTSYDGINTAIGRGLGGVIPDSATIILEAYRRDFI